MNVTDFIKTKRKMLEHAMLNIDDYIRQVNKEYETKVLRLENAKQSIASRLETEEVSARDIMHPMNIMKMDMNNKKQYDILNKDNNVRFYEMYPGVWIQGSLFLEPDFKAIRAPMLSIIFRDDKLFEEQLGILDFIPYIPEYWVNEYGSKWKNMGRKIGIFCDNMDGDTFIGSYDLLIEKDGSYSIVNDYRHSQTYNSKDIIKTLRYIYDIHFNSKKKHLDD